MDKQTQDQTDYSQHSIAGLAAEIRRDWRPVNYAAKPYLENMFMFQHISENNGYESARSAVLYFLSNASTWRGEKAKAIKAELKKRLKR